MSEQPTPTDAQRAAREQLLLKRIHQDGDQMARDQLAEEMLPLARALAGRYAGRGEPLDDLVQVACIGIMKAIDGFDLSREVRFSSYATPTVLGEIKRHFRDKTWAVRVPRGLQEMQIKVAKARDKLTNELGRSPTVQELVRRRSTSPSRRCSRRSRAPTPAARARSRSRPARTRRWATRSAAPTRTSGARRCACCSTRRSTCCRERDREVLRLRFAEDLTQTEISTRIGVSQMQVSRIIRQALARLRMDIERSADRSADVV